MDTSIWRPKRATTFRRGGWLAVVTLLGLGLGLGLAAPVFASTATVTSLDHGATITVPGVFPNGQWAGDLNGTIDTPVTHAVKFYCIDTKHEINVPSPPYTSDVSTGPEITYILNNYYPAATGSGQLTSLDYEAAAIQLAIWSFSDNMSLTGVTPADIGDRANAIAKAAASATLTSSPIVTTLKIVSASQTNPSGTAGTFTVEAFDASNARMKGVVITLSTTSGSTLSATSVTTTSATETSVTLTQHPQTTLAATVTATTARAIPGGTIYVDATNRDTRQKLVIATPTNDTLATTGGFTWTASPTITTVANPTTGIVGVAITAAGDTATFHNAYNPTGSVSFTLYSDSLCKAATSLTGPGLINSSGVASFSGSFTPPAAGTYYWVASYAGDTNNAAFTTTCGDAGELVIVSKAGPTITTTTGGPVVLGSSAKLTDTAHLTGGYSPTGTITFTLTDPTNALRDTETATVAGNGNYPTPSGFTPDMVGTWHWVASYGGDANNNKVASGPDDEPVVVSPASPAITTILSKSKGTVGDTIYDSANLTGTTATAGGKVTYTVYTNTACTSGAIDAGTKTVTNGSVPNSDGIVFNSVGTWYWQAVYSGDASNAAATSACTEETLVVDPTPSASTSATPTPFQSFQGETATPVRAITPPPTTVGGGPSGDSPTPFFALMICFAFGGLGLLAVQRQRRTLSR
jgi:hypothetical protein